MHLIYPATLGVFPLKELTVNYSSGYKVTRSGPNTIRDSLVL
jgi:hypothetical protein